MNNKTNIYTLIVSLMFLLAGCTPGKGDLGILFGPWVLEEMTADGRTVAQPEGTYTAWSFNSDIIMVSLTDAYHSTEKRFGTFCRPDEATLTIDFSHSSNDIAAGTGIYQAPGWMGFPAEGTFGLRIMRLTRSEMTLSWDNSEGINYTYYFKKTR